MASSKTDSHTLIADIKAVAGRLGRSPMRDEYIELGKFSKHKVVDQFGGWSEALVASGLVSARRPTSHDKEREKFELKETLNKAFNEQLLPYNGKYEKKKFPDIMRMVYGSDFHSIWTDPFCLHVFIEACRRVQPDVIGLVGDIFDFYMISTYSKDPSRILKLQSEIDFITTKIFKPLRDACPNAQIDFFIGNHEWRLFKYLAMNASGLASLRSLQFNNLFELDKYKINLVAKKSFLNATKEKDLKNYKLYGDKLFCLTHGTALAQQHAAAELKKYGVSGASGHVHHYQVQSTRTLHGEQTWTTMGCMCRMESGEEYIEDLVRWNQGFEIAHLDVKARKVVKEYIHICDGMAVVGGVYYSRKDLRK